jgi:CRISPR-associated endonuclease Cas1
MYILFLSFLYTLLTHDCASALETVGLDPYVGFLHRDRPGRMSLALDLMEEMRPFVVDRLVLSMINRKQITVSDFDTEVTGSVLLSDEGRKKVLVAWQEAKQDRIKHPFLGESISRGLIPHVQVIVDHWEDDKPRDKGRENSSTHEKHRDQDERNDRNNFHHLNDGNHEKAQSFKTRC